MTLHNLLSGSQGVWEGRFLLLALIPNIRLQLMHEDSSSPFLAWLEAQQILLSVLVQFPKAKEKLSELLKFPWNRMNCTLGAASVVYMLLSIMDEMGLAYGTFKSVRQKADEATSRSSPFTSHISECFCCILSFVPFVLSTRTPTGEVRIYRNLFVSWEDCYLSFLCYMKLPAACYLTTKTENQEPG